MSYFLDIKSLIRSDYYKSNKRIKWHLDHSHYDQLTEDLYDWLINVEISSDERKIYDVSVIFIFTELASYITHVYDYLHLSKKGIMPIYSNQSNIFIEKIWEKKVIESSLLIELEKSRFKFDRKKHLYTFLLRIFPKRFLKSVLVSTNELSNQYLRNNKGINLKLFSQYFFSINLTSSSFSKKLSSKVSNDIVNKIENDYFRLNDDHIKSIKFIIDSYISRAYNNINAFNNSSLRFQKNISIITGTGYSYYNRLISSSLAKKNVKIIRFNHGGERCFFNDRHFWAYGELFRTDLYVTYGKKWKAWLENHEKSLKGNIDIKSIGSKYHKKFYDKFFDKKTSNNKKILYIPNSFIGEIRVFPYAKLIDPILFDWQKYLIEILEKNGFEVIYKKHPKGLYHEENFLSSLASYESNKPMIEALEEADMVLCDMAGSAFVESICAGKKIVLVDTKQRPFDQNNKKDLQEAVKIVDAFWEDNIPKVHEQELVDAFNNFDINKDKMKKIIYEYFLSSDHDNT